MHRSSILRGVIPAIAAVVLFIVVIVWRVTVLNASFVLQDRVNYAIRLNDKVLQLQLDEETGIRGYAATQKRALLARYVAAEPALVDGLGVLTASTERIGVPSAGTLIGELRTAHDAWLQQVALPTLREVSPRTAQLEVRGKALVDRFRDASAQLGAAIELRAHDANRQTRLGLIALTFASLLAVVVAAWLIGGSFLRNRRLLDQIAAEQAIIEKIPQMVWTKDANGQNDYCNQRFLDYMHVTMDEFIHNSWIVAHPDDVERGQAIWRAAVETGTAYETELRLRPKDRTVYRWFLVRAVPYRDASGRVVKWFGTTTDIDAQRRASEAMDFLAQSGARLAGAQDVPAVLDRLAHAALEGLADISIFDLEEEDGTFRRLTTASPGVPQTRVEATGAFDAPRPGEPHPIARAMASGETIHVPYVDEEFITRSVTPAKRQEAWRVVDIRSIVVAPMRIPGRVLGALTLLRTGTSVPFETSEVKVIEEVARRAAVAIDNIRLAEREQLAARNLQAFADMGESTAEQVGLQATLDAALRAVVPARTDWAFITLADERGDLRLAAVTHPDDTLYRALSAHIGELYAGAALAQSVAAEAMRTRLPVFRERASYENAVKVVNPPVLESIWRAGLASFAVVPLFAGSAVRGTVHLCRVTADQAFTRGDLDFFAEFARRLAPAIANAELFERERRVAQSFQAAALPASLPSAPGFVFHAIYEAGKAEALVGGDWYDAFALADGRIVVSIGDVAGSGLSAAVTMASVRQAIRGAAHVRPDPQLLLDAADLVLEDATQRFVTAFVGVIDPAASTIVFQSAGHPPPLLRMPDGTVAELPLGGAPLGLRMGAERVTQSQVLPAGSLLALYTDGLTESTRDVFEGEGRLRCALASAVVYDAENPAQQLHDVVLADGSRDDVAILTIRVVAVS